MRRAAHAPFLAAAVSAMTFAPTAWGQQSNWQSGSANWTTAASWTNGVPNSPTSIAVIDFANGGSAYTVTLNTLVQLQELDLNHAKATLSHTANTLTVGLANITAGSYRLAGGTITGGTWTVAAPASFVVTSGVLSGVNFSGKLDVSTGIGPFLRITNNTTFVAGSTLDMAPNTITGGQFRIDQATLDNLQVNILAAGGTGPLISAEGSGNTLTLGANFKLLASSGATLSSNAGGGTNTAILNNGLLRADAGGTIVISPQGVFTNAGTGVVRVNGGTINLNNAGWRNTDGVTPGLIDVISGTLNLGGSFNGANFGNFTRSGGTVNLTGAMTINPADTFTLDNVKGSWVLSGGSVTGGNLTTAGTSKLIAAGNGNNRFDGVNFSGKLDVSTGIAPFLRITNNTTFVAGSTLDMAQNTVTAGQFRVDQASLDNLQVNILTSSGNAAFVSAEGNGNTVTLGSNAQLLAAGAATLTSNLGGGTNTAVLNHGLLQSNAGGTITINPQGVFTNAGTGIVRANGGAINLNSAGWRNSDGVTPGIIDVVSGTLNLGGSFNAANFGTFTRASGGSAGTVNLTGAMTINPADTFTLDNAKGSWILSGGSVTGGNFTTTGTNKLFANSSGGTLLGVNFSGKLDVASGIAPFLRIANNTTFVAGSTLDMAPNTVTAGQFRIDQAALDNLQVNVLTGGGTPRSSRPRGAAIRSRLASPFSCSRRGAQR